jgi:hypothetical protein
MAPLDRGEAGSVVAHLATIVVALGLRQVGARSLSALPPVRLGHRDDPLQHVADRRAGFDAEDDHPDLDVVERGEVRPLGLGQVEVGERGWKTATGQGCGRS